jgi:hypothetical protein
LAQFDYTLDETSIGMTIGPPNGFVVNLTRTQAGPYDPPQWSEGRQRWKAGRFVLRGSNDVRDLVCIDTQHGGGWASHGGLSDIVMGDASIDYAGDLEIVCVPKGSTWTITLSDVPNPRAPLPTPGWAPARRGVRRRERPQAYPAVVEASRRPAAAPPRRRRSCTGRRTGRRKCSGRCGRGRRPPPPIEMQGRTFVIVRGAPKRPLITVGDDADRASRIIARIQQRCPELSRDDFVPVARAINDFVRS